MEETVHVHSHTKASPKAWQHRQDWEEQLVEQAEHVGQLDTPDLDTLEMLDVS